MQLNVYTESVINEDNFSFKQKTVTLDQVGSGVTNYATVTLDDETIELNPSTLDDTTLAKLGLSAVSYKYYTDSSKSAVTVAPTSVGQTYVFITLTPATGYETPVVDGYYAVIYVQDIASEKTITYVMNNNKVAQVEPKKTTAAIFTDDLLPNYDNVPGYRFDGWYDDDTFTRQINTTSVISGNMTLYAKWTQTAFTVSYEENLVGVDEVANAELVNAIPSESDLPSLTDPYDNYTFEGWYTDAKCTTKAIAETAITADTTLYAKWNKKGELSTTTLIDETFDIIHPESIPGVTVSGGNVYTNTNGALVATPNGTSGSIKFDFNDIVNTEAKAATISFKLTEAVNAKSWASFRLYGSSTSDPILDNSGTKDVFAIRWNGTRDNDNDDTTYAKVAGTTYIYTINAVFTTSGMNITVTATDGDNTYKLVENHAFADTKISYITFGNASDSTRAITLDDLKVLYVVE